MVSRDQPISPRHTSCILVSRIGSAPQHRVNSRQTNSVDHVVYSRSHAFHDGNHHYEEKIPTQLESNPRFSHLEADVGPLHHRVAAALQCYISGMFDHFTTAFGLLWLPAVGGKREKKRSWAPEVCSVLQPFISRFFSRNNSARQVQAGRARSARSQPGYSRLMVESTSQLAVLVSTFSRRNVRNIGQT